MKKLNFSRSVLEVLSSELSKETRDQMAIPSYLHSNPFIQWIITKRMNSIINLLNIQDGHNLVDFGCGTGMLLLQIPEGKIRYYGIDLITWPAQKVLAAHGRKDFILLDVEHWIEQIPPKSIDSIVAVEVLEHIEDIRDITQKFLQMLKPGGRLIISGPTENFLYQVARRIAGFTGEYHVRGIHGIRKEIEEEGFVQIGKSINIPFIQPLTLFVICAYKSP